MTTTEHGITAADVRRRVGHPIVDGDGHFLEFMPLVNDEIMSYLEESGGIALAERYQQQVRGPFDTAVFQTDRRCPTSSTGGRRCRRGGATPWPTPTSAPPPISLRSCTSGSTSSASISWRSTRAGPSAWSRPATTSCGPSPVGA